MNGRDRVLDADQDAAGEREARRIHAGHRAKACEQRVERLGLAHGRIGVWHGRGERRARASGWSAFRRTLARLLKLRESRPAPTSITVAMASCVRNKRRARARLCSRRFRRRACRWRGGDSWPTDAAPGAIRTARTASAAEAKRDREEARVDAHFLHAGQHASAHDQPEHALGLDGHKRLDGRHAGRPDGGAACHHPRSRAPGTR